jgi:L-fuculose-phosphate aldolase
LSEIESTKEAVLETVRAMDRTGLTEGTAGNVSARTSNDEVVLTPTALAYDCMTLDDLVVTDLRRHRDIAAVVHSHAVHASMFAANHESIPSVIEEVDLYLGGEVRVTDYHPTGTEALGKSTADLLQDRGAVLLANHGLVTVAQTPAEALRMTRLVERTAKIIWGAKLIGEPRRLPDQARARFTAMYRKRRKAASETIQRPS